MIGQTIKLLSTNGGQCVYWVNVTKVDSYGIHGGFELGVDFKNPPVSFLNLAPGLFPWKSVIRLAMPIDQKYNLGR